MIVSHLGQLARRVDQNRAPCYTAPMPRGPKPRPPRTDPGEIQRNRDVKIAEANERAANSYPPLRSAPPAKQDPHRLEPSRGTLTLEQIKILASDETCPAAMMAKALPQRPPWADAQPPWIKKAFAESINLVNEKLCKGALTENGIAYFVTARISKILVHLAQARPFDVQLSEEDAAAFARHFDTKAESSYCFCCGVPVAVLLERSARGLESLIAHSVTLESLWRPFAAGAADEDRADMFLRIVVPTYNAANFDSRRCVECGKVFALRTRREAEISNRCDDCQGRFHSRESQRRRRAAPDLAGRVRGKEQGEAAVAAAERKMAQDNPWEQEERAVWRLDMIRAQERRISQSAPEKVKAQKKERPKNK